MVGLVYLCSNHADMPRTPEELRKLATPVTANRPQKRAKRTWSRLSEQAKAEIVAAYEAGEHSTKIAVRFNVSKTMVLSILHDSGTKLRNQPMTDADIAKAVQLYEAGHALSELANQLPFSQEAIRKALIASGTPLRPARRL